jgi:hypothetical protein
MIVHKYLVAYEDRICQLAGVMTKTTGRQKYIA